MNIKDEIDLLRANVLQYTESQILFKGYEELEQMIKSGKIVNELRAMNPNIQTLFVEDLTTLNDMDFRNATLKFLVSFKDEEAVGTVYTFLLKITNKGISFNDLINSL